MIDEDEFAQWREHPITQAYFDRVAAEGVRTKDAWHQLAWDAGNLSEREYAYHKGRVETLDYMASLGFVDLFPKEEQ